MARYAIEQRLFIVEQYFKNNECLAAVVRKFHTKYGRNTVLTSSTVKRLIEKFRETGSVGDAKQTGRPKTSRSNVNIEAVRASVVDNPGTSIRRRGQELQISKSSLQRILTKNIAAKRNPQQDAEAQEWIETVLGAKFPPGELYEDVIRDGTVLCQLINKLAPGSVPKINTSGGQFKMMENINNFQAAIKKYGVADVDVFQTVDLWEKKDIATVTNTIFALGRTTYKHPEWSGPYLGPKPADENKREFTEEQLRAGETIVGLQAGTNKGASQSGQNIGAGRKIILGK